MSVRTGRTCCVVLFLAGLFTAPAAYSAPTDCIQDAPDGRFVCKTPLPSPIGINPCDSAADSLQRQKRGARRAAHRGMEELVLDSLPTRTRT